MSRVNQSHIFARHFHPIMYHNSNLSNARRLRGTARGFNIYNCKFHRVAKVVFFSNLLLVPFPYFCDSL